MRRRRGDLDGPDKDGRLVARFAEQIAREVGPSAALTTAVRERLGARQTTELVL